MAGRPSGQEAFLQALYGDVRVSPCEELTLECQHTVTFGVRQQPLWCDPCEKILMLAEEFISYIIDSVDHEDWEHYLDVIKFQGLTFAEHMARGHLEEIQVIVRILKNDKGASP